LPFLVEVHVSYTVEVCTYHTNCRLRYLWKLYLLWLFFVLVGLYKHLGGAAYMEWQFQRDLPWREHRLSCETI